MTARTKMNRVLFINLAVLNFLAELEREFKLDRNTRRRIRSTALAGW